MDVLSHVPAIPRKRIRSQNNPVVLPDVQLLDVDGIKPEVGEALLRDVISGERLL